MKAFIKNFLTGLTLIILSFCLNTVKAQDGYKTYIYDNVKVDIKIDKSSAVEVTERFTYEFQGTFRGVFREITLSSDADRVKCQNDPSLQCGGFERLELIEVYDNQGNILPKNAYTLEEIYDDVSQEKRLKITWVFAQDGRYFNNEKFDFGIKYIVYKSIGYFEDYDLLYWNALFPDRTVNIKSSEVNIFFPEAHIFSKDKLDVLAGYAGYDYNYEYFEAQNKLTIQAPELYPGEEFTILYMLPKGMVLQPPKLNIKEGNHETDLKFVEADRQLTYFDSTIEFDTAGKHIVKAKAFGYETQKFELDLKNGEIKELEVQLKPTLWGIILYGFVLLLNCLSILAIPGGIVFVYLLWHRKGRDKGQDKTIIPIFEPPQKITSYMLGSIKDEKVDMVDISSVIIDLAYKGYIKIIEHKGKGLFSSTYYAFEKLTMPTGRQEGSDSLSDAEKKLMDAIFKSSDKTDTKKLTNTFYKSIPGIQDSIYAEMVGKHYFEKNPKDVRTNYIIGGVLLLMLGILMTIFLTVFLMAINYLLLFGTFLGIAFILMGIGYFIIANFMPAKTELGKEILQKIKGFRMFIFHAERYKLQNLTPSMFEKYLSYAVVFGLEKQWGEAFKDIYKGQPEWYQGDSSTFNSIILANSLSSMMSSTSTALASAPSSSGSSSGGGWSGGGGFSGGFSGGGGGGGGGGAF